MMWYSKECRLVVPHFRHFELNERQIWNVLDFLREKRNKERVDSEAGDNQKWKGFKNAIPSLTKKILPKKKNLHKEKAWVNDGCYN